MRELEGFELPGLPVMPASVEDLKLMHVRDIESYEGPLLAEFEDRNGRPYLYKWCDCDDDANRWLVFRTTDEALGGYEAGKKTLRQVLLECPEGYVYVVDLDKEGIARSRVKRVWARQLPDDYIPTTDSWHEGGD